MKIIDVSKFQGNIDWNKVKADGVEGAIIRAVSTNSAGLYKDGYFERNYSECKRLGIPVGAYYYTYATNKLRADKELELFKSCLDGKQFELPIIFDVEDASLKPLSKKDLTDLTIYALDAIESWGCYRMYYTGYYYGLRELDESRLTGRYDKWLADWRDYGSGKPSGEYGMWQYTNNGTVSGINGRVDMSYAYRDYPTIIKNAGLNGFKKPTPVDPVDPPEPTEPDPDFTEEEKGIIMKIIRFLLKLIGGKK